MRILGFLELALCLLTISVCQSPHFKTKVSK